MGSNVYLELEATCGGGYAIWPFLIFLGRLFSSTEQVGKYEMDGHGSNQFQGDGWMAAGILLLDNRKLDSFLDPIAADT